MEDRQETVMLIDNDGVLKLYEPYAELTIETEEDFNRMNELLALGAAVKNAFKEGFVMVADRENAIENVEDLLKFDQENKGE